MSISNLERIIKKAQEMGMKVEKINWKNPLVKITYGQKSKYFYGSLLPLNNTVGARLSRYKNLTKKIFIRLGIPTPKGFLCENLEEILKIIKEGKIKYPLVIKPNSAALGEGVIVAIDNDKELKIAVKKLSKKYKEFLVEEYVEGDDYRLLVLDGKVIAVCKRILPFVVGNGKKSLGELINDFNQNREKKLEIDWEVKRHLKEQKIDLNTIISQGRKIILRKNANIYTGGIAEDVTDIVSPYFKKLAIKIVEELGLRLAGVDILSADISNSRGAYYFTEVNGLPSFDIHEIPIIGKKRDVTSLILKAIFSS